MIGYLGDKQFSSRDELVRYMREQLLGKRKVAVDAETHNLQYTQPVGIGIAASGEEAFYFTIEPELEDEIPWKVLIDPGVLKVFHNALFDLNTLIDFHIDDTNIVDTSTICRLLCQPAKLTEAVGRFLPGMEVHDMSEYISGSQTTMELPLEVLSRKCCQDVMATYALHEVLGELVDQQYLAVEMDIIPILIGMSRRGIGIDHEERVRLEGKYETDKVYYGGLCKEYGFNPGSSQQVGYILAKRNNLLPMRRVINKRTGKREVKISTRAENMVVLEDPLAQAVLGYRKASKILSTYLRPMEIHDRAYCRWHTEARTGRITSTRRNLQNIPPEVRSMYIPDNEHFTDWDATQIELRCLAYISGDEEMQEVFDSGGDIHQDTADFMGIERRIAKNVGFAMIYGATAKTIMETAGIQSRGMAEQLRDMWFDRYKMAGLWIVTTQEEGLRNGMVRTLYGRTLKLPSLEEEREDGIRRKAVNYIIQGSAAEIIKRVMVKCSQLPVVLQVHDELIADGDAAEGVRKLDLDHIAPFHIPFKIRLMERWEV